MSSKKIHSNIIAMGLVSFFVQIGATLVYTTCDSFVPSTMLTENNITTMRNISGSVSTIFPVFSGLISDYFLNRKNILILSYGSTLLFKLLFLLCMVLINSGVNHQYIGVGYVVIHTLDRITNCLRDSPQGALILDSTDKKNELRDFGIRKAIASMGSILGGIASYFILKYKPITSSTTYCIAVIPVLIGNLILYFFVKDIFIKEEVNSTQKILNIDTKNISVKTNNEEFLFRYLVGGFISLISILGMCYLNLPYPKYLFYFISAFGVSMMPWNKLFKSVYLYGIFAIYCYCYQPSRFVFILMLTICNNMFNIENMLFGVKMIFPSLLIILRNSNSYSIKIILLLLAIITSIYSKKNIPSSVDNPISWVLGMMHKIWYFLFIVLTPLMIPGFLFPITCLLLAVNQILLHYKPSINKNYTFLVISSLFIFNISNMFNTTLCVILGFIQVYFLFDEENIMIIIPKNLIHLIVFSLLGSISHPTIFLVLLSLYIIYNQEIKNLKRILDKIAIGILIGIFNYYGFSNVGYVASPLFFQDILYSSPLDSFKTIPMVSFIALVSYLLRLQHYISYFLLCSLPQGITKYLFILAKAIIAIFFLLEINKKWNKSLKMFSCMTLSFILMLKISLPLSFKIILSLAFGNFFYNIINYILKLSITQEYLKHKKSLKKLLVLCGITGMVNLASHNHLIFYRHGQHVLGWGAERIPIMFVILYASMTIFSFIFKKFKSHANKLFYVLILSLGGANLLFLNQSSHVGFIISIVLLALYSSGVSVVFSSFISDCTPKENLKATTFSIYYLISSIFKIFNAILISHFQQSQKSILIFSYELTSMGLLGVGLSFLLFVIAILWAILSYGNFWNSNSLSETKNLSR